MADKLSTLPYSNNIIQTYLDAYGAAAALINGVSPAGFWIFIFNTA